MATTIAELQGILTLDDTQFKSGLTGARSGLGNLGSGITSAGKKMATFGAGMSLALAPVTIFLKSSIDAFRDFDVAMTNSQAILGATTEEMELLSAQVLEIGSNTGLGPQAVADAFFTVVSGVQDATTHMDILQNSVNLAEAGLADLAVTTSGMVAIMNAYRFSAEDASFVSDVFTRTVQMGVGTMDEFVAALSPLGSLANTLGISFDELAGAEALLTSKGVSAAQAATQLQGVMTAFIKPNQAMVDALELMGFASGQVAIETLGLQGAVDLLSLSLEEDTGKMAQALGRTEALNGALVLAGEGAEEFLEAFSGGVEGATDAARDLQNATDEAISAAFIAKIDALKILIGDGLSGAIADVQRELIPFVDKIIDWAIKNPDTVETIVMMVAALIGFGFALVIVGGLIAALGTVIGLLLSPTLLAVGAGLALGLMIKPLIEDTDDLTLAIELLTPVVLTLALAYFGVSFPMALAIGLGVALAIGIIELNEETGNWVITLGIITPLVLALGLAMGVISFPIAVVILAIVGAIFVLDALAKALGFEGVTEMLVDTIETWKENFELFETIIDRLGAKIEGLFSKAAEVSGIEGLEEAGPAVTGILAPFGVPKTILGLLGFAEGGEFQGMEAIRVGEDGPETVVFPEAGTVVPNNRQSDQPLVGTVNVFASTFEGGQAAARGFNSEITELRRAEG